MDDVKISKIAPLDKLKIILDSIAKATGMNLCVLDTVGNVVVYPCNDALFCKTARLDPELRKKCLTAAAHSAFESARSKKTLVYKCFFGLTDFSVPLYYKGEYIGAICGGSARCDMDKSRYDYQQPLLQLDDYPSLKKIYEGMSDVGEERFFSMIKVVENLVDYINHHGLMSTIKQVDAKKATGLNKLQPALQYIENNYKENIRIADLAAMCYINETYFSRLFSTIVGSTVSQFILEKRIIKAKELLRNKGMKIQAVAEEVGYDDPAYFVRKFKQVTGVTPSAYQSSTEYK